MILWQQAVTNGEWEAEDDIELAQAKHKGEMLMFAVEGKVDAVEAGTDDDFGPASHADERIYYSAVQASVFVWCNDPID